jgi:hypothetical protein
MEVRSLDTTSSGSGSSSTHRVQVSLWPEGSPVKSPPSEAADSVDPIETRLDRIIELLTDIHDEIRRR